MIPTFKNTSHAVEQEKRKAAAASGNLEADAVRRDLKQSFRAAVDSGKPLRLVGRPETDAVKSHKQETERRAALFKEGITRFHEAESGGVDELRTVLMAVSPADSLLDQVTTELRYVARSLLQDQNGRRLWSLGHALATDDHSGQPIMGHFVRAVVETLKTAVTDMHDDTGRAKTAVGSLEAHCGYAGPIHQLMIDAAKEGLERLHQRQSVPASSASGGWRGFKFF